MTIHNRTGVVALSLLAVLLVGPGPIRAQEPSPSASKPSGPVPAKKSIRRVPDYFGQIGLTPEQRASIYGVLNQRQEKIEALERQIASERAEMIRECEAVLTETQKKLLENLRKAASEPKPAPSAKPTETTKTAK